MEKNIWGRRIRAFRKLKGYTQEEFAKMLGISVSILGEVERGSRNANENLLKQAAKVLKVTHDELTSIK